MKTNVVENHGRIFKNPILESFTKSNPNITIGYYSCMIVFFVYLSIRLSPLTSLQTFIIYSCGLISWTLIEYILHRYIFHINDYFPSFRRLHYILHGIHHQNPRDKQRLFMPPLPGAIIAFFLTLLWYVFLGNNVYAFMAGITNGYLLYSYIHYTVHTNPKKLMFPTLWSHHLKHHYQFPDKAYGVSSPLWDILFNTMPPENHPINNNKK
ncbi:MAG: sterol desaturase family protein [Bacteroidetes bacterium]|nr:sterol desaturase family protein [Bacteroidota bacterium]